MSRFWSIARREYLAYVRTLGFWLSLCLTPVGMLVAFGGPALLDRSAPPPRIAVVDLTGQGYEQAITQALERPEARPGGPSSPTAMVIGSPIAGAGTASEAGRTLRPLLARGHDGAQARLDAAAVVHLDHGAVAVDFWSRDFSPRGLEDTVRDAVAQRMSALRLTALGVSGPEIEAAAGLAPKVADYSAAAGSKASLRDRLPGLAGFALGMLLWMMIISGSGILLNSVIEEKSSRILEVLLSSASTSEIMGGKIVGVACVTVTVLGTWIAIGSVLLAAADPHLAQALVGVLLTRGLALYFGVYLIGGYLMYAALFAAIGAHCETTREAQSLLAPMMMLTTIPIVFLSQAIIRPETPALNLLAWFPPFTPFLMPALAASDPPLWQVLGTMALTAASAAASLLLSARAFRAGALAGGRSDSRSLLLRVFRPEVG